MARMRILKPGFFANQDLSRIEAHGRLLFAGLWTVADKEGRLKDDPLWIKGQVFPYESVDCENLLGQLAKSKFIKRYRAEGMRYIQVINWHKHQRPHQNETDSVIPESTERSKTSTNGTSPSDNVGTKPPSSKSVTESDPENDNGNGVGSPESRTEPESPIGARTTSEGVPSGFSESPLLTDFAILLKRVQQEIGQTTIDQLRCFREYHGEHQDWAWAAVNETLTAPRPSCDYLMSIIKRSVADQKPPSSLAASRR